ncbi:hypothetical protein [Vibrio phage BONAISHI]|nr:hypothetical protein [Vibrio phage BONAISHI]
MASYEVNTLNDAKAQSASEGDQITVKDTGSVYIVKDPLDASTASVKRNDGNVLVFSSAITVTNNSTSIKDLKENPVGSDIDDYDTSKAYKTGDIVYHDNRLLEANKDTSGTFTEDDWDIKVGPPFTVVNNRFTGVKTLIAEFKSFTPESGYYGMRYLEIKNAAGEIVNPDAIEYFISSPVITTNTGGGDVPDTILKFKNPDVDNSSSRALWPGSSSLAKRSVTRMVIVFNSPIDVHSMRVMLAKNTNQTAEYIRVFGSAVDTGALGAVDFLREPWIKLMGSFYSTDINNPGNSEWADLEMEDGGTLPRYYNHVKIADPVGYLTPTEYAGGRSFLSAHRGYIDPGKKLAGVIWTAEGTVLADFRKAAASFTNALTVGSAFVQPLKEPICYVFDGNRYDDPSPLGSAEPSAFLLDFRSNNFITPATSYVLVSTVDANGDPMQAVQYSSVSTVGFDENRGGYENKTYYTNDAIADNSSFTLSSSYGNSANVMVIYED